VGGGGGVWGGLLVGVGWGGRWGLFGWVVWVGLGGGGVVVRGGLWVGGVVGVCSFWSLMLYFCPPPGQILSVLFLLRRWRVA